MLARLMPVVCLLTACAPTEAPDKALPQLEAIGTTITVDGAPWGTDSTSRRERLTITGSGQEYTITTRDEQKGPLVLQLHSPGFNDITSMTDRVGSVNIAPSDSPGWPRTLVITSDTGGAYIADVGNGTQEVDAAFPWHVVDFGKARQTVEDDDGVTRYFDLVVHADDGDVSFLPGEVDYVTIGDEIWRFTAVAAYQREPVDDVGDCPQVDDVLSYEFLRLPEAGTAEKLRRAAGTEVAALNCEE